MTDFQPKNVLVAGNASICLIDIDYCAGCPALELAQFLVALTRMRLRHPHPTSARMLATWQQEFLTSYFKSASPDVAGDLVFFYPWILLSSLRMHLATRPFLRPFLAKFYGRRLYCFLTRLQRFSPKRCHKTWIELFTDSDGLLAPTPGCDRILDQEPELLQV